MSDEPRHSALGAMRESRLTTRKWQSVRVSNPFTSAALVPAYSTDSNVVACGFSTTNEGNILIRRTPENQTGKEATSLAITGGACWCPTNNKFYHGSSGPGATTDGKCIVIDPAGQGFEVITGFPTSGSGQRTIFIPSTGEVWMHAPVGNPKAWAIIDPSDNSFEWIEDANVSSVVDFTYCADNDCIYLTTVFRRIYRIDIASRAVTMIYDEAAFEATYGAVTGFSFGPVEYVDSLGEFWVYVNSSTLGEGLMRFNAATDTEISTDFSLVAFAMAALWYSADFDRVIMARTLTFGSTPIISSINPATMASVQLGAATVDVMSAPKGCYCDTPNKIAIPVQTGIAPNREFTVKFYGTSEL